VTEGPSRRAALGGLAAAAMSSPANAQGRAMPTVLITGANRGLGLEFVRQYQARKYKIIATARKPSEATELQALAKADKNISIEPLDVTDLKAIDALAAKLKGVPIDILLNNAGVIGRPVEEVFGSIPYGHFEDVMNTNVRGPLKMCEAFVENVAASQQKKFAVVTSVEGSIASQKSGARYFYKSSKAALNMAMRNVMFAVKDRGILVAMVCPGGTDTDMIRQLNLNMKFRDPKDAVRDMIGLIDAVTPERNGVSYNYDGAVMPW
jgi:NAD(P)-dependent dehydrogenase (short-subunit alcohol dehydrogenase family)